MRRHALALLLLMLFAGAPMAQAEQAIVSLSADHIEIDSNFTGTELTVFGGIEREADGPKRNGPYDVIMIVRGPLGAVTLREKESTGPFWLNRAQQEYPAVLSYVSVLSDRPVEEIIDTMTQARLATSVEAQVRPGGLDQARGADFTKALIRIRRAQGLFSDESDAVTFLSSTLFRATIRLPGAAPLGRYEVEVLGFAEGKTIATAQTGFFVRRGGIEHVLAVAAHDHGIAYGFAVIAMALGCGVIASVIFRRD